MVRLPAYAPGLNPAEGSGRTWRTAWEPRGQHVAIVRNRLKRGQRRPALIDRFLAETGLTVEPEPQ